MPRDCVSKDSVQQFSVAGDKSEAQEPAPSASSRRSSVVGPPDLAEIRIHTPLSIIVPTFRERENLPALVERIDSLRRRYDLTLELLVMDDDSQDGTKQWVAQHAPPWVQLVTRTGPRGLSPAVVEGMERARHPVLVTMDADLSHPPERIPSMILALQSGQEMALGSRYVPGGRTDENWGFLRWLNSKVATLLARPLTTARDPMSGFFAMRRSVFERRAPLTAVGYKIGLELIVKCGVENVAEIPIHFTDRVRGESKLSLREQVNYLVHLRRLYIHKYANWSTLVQFLGVGALGAVVNLAVHTAVLELGGSRHAALVSGIVVSVLSNFVLNRAFTFQYARDRSIMAQFFGFLLASSAGMVVNYLSSLAALAAWPEVPSQVAALVGIAAGTGLNFVANRYFVFKSRPQPGASAPLSSAGKRRQ